MTRTQHTLTRKKKKINHYRVAHSPLRSVPTHSHTQTRGLERTAAALSARLHVCCSPAVRHDWSPKQTNGLLPFDLEPSPSPSPPGSIHPSIDVSLVSLSLDCQLHTHSVRLVLCCLPFQKGEGQHKTTETTD